MVSSARIALRCGNEFKHQGARLLETGCGRGAGPFRAGRGGKSDLTWDSPGFLERAAKAPLENDRMSGAFAAAEFGITAKVVLRREWSRSAGHPVQVDAA